LKQWDARHLSPLHDLLGFSVEVVISPQSLTQHLLPDAHLLAVDVGKLLDPGGKTRDRQQDTQERHEHTHTHTQSCCTTSGKQSLVSEMPRDDFFNFTVTGAY